MEFKITIKNYRCFSEAHPVSFEFGEGFTALLGPNNSGKSSVLRFFYEFRSLFQNITNPNWLGPVLLGQKQGFSPSRSVLDVTELFHNGNNRDLTLEIFVAPLCLLITLDRGSTYCSAQVQIGGDTIDGKTAAIQDGRMLSDGRVIGDLRGMLECCTFLANALYIGPFRNAINFGSNQEYFDIQVGQAFISQWRQIKTGNAIKQNEAANTLTQDIKRIFQFRDFEINASDDGMSLQLFMDGRSFKLPTVGAGLTQFIMVLANAAVREPSCILIDEPELNLHPSLQIDFLTTLASYSHGQVVFATHNVGLARATAKRIYSLQTMSVGLSRMATFEAAPHLTEFLGEMSFSGYLAMDVRKVLLVEGTTDLTAIQQFLRSLGKDHKVVMLPLGGGQLIGAQIGPHLEELRRISPEIFVVIDSERNSATASLARPRKQFVDACKVADIPCLVLEKRALENYLSDRAIKKVKGEKYRALDSYEVLTAASPSWSKSENWQIAREMTVAEFEDTDLGRFLKAI